MTPDSETVLIAETGLGKYQVEARMGNAALLIDEPLEAGGLGSGPNPYDLISAAVGAMVLAYTERTKQGRLTQREQVEARIRGRHPSPLPGPGVFATLNSVATPALLPDGSPAPQSRSELLESTASERLKADVRSVTSAGAEPDARALRAPVTPPPVDEEEQ